MYKLYKQEDSKSCGLVAIKNLFQTEVEYDFTKCQNLIGMENTIRELFDEELYGGTAFYDHEGVEKLPEYLETYVEDIPDNVYGSPFLIHTKGKVPSLNHIFVAVKVKEGWEIYDGLKPEVIKVNKLSDLEGHIGYYGVYFIRGLEGNMLTWFEWEEEPQSKGILGDVIRGVDGVEERGILGDIIRN